MTRLIALLAGSLTLTSGLSAQEKAAVPAPKSLRVVAWNLQWFPGKFPAPTREQATAHIVEVRNALKAMKPDILVLEEVASENAVAEALTGIPELKVVVVSRFKSANGLIDAQQIAICSRYPARFVYSSRWERGWAGPPRGFAYAALDTGGGVIHVTGLHLKSNLGDPQGNTAKREDAMEQVLKHLKQSGKEANSDSAGWIICGDFNTDEVNTAVPSERTFRLLRDDGFFWSFQGVPHSRRVTCPAKGKYPPASFDHIFLKGLGKPVAAPVSNIFGSDHLPVSVDVSLPMSPAKTPATPTASTAPPKSP